MNFIDTADVYGHDPANFSVGRGRSEEIIGAALREANARELLPMAQSYGLAVLPWSPTAGGFLAGGLPTGRAAPARLALRRVLARRGRALYRGSLRRPC